MTESLARSFGCLGLALLAAAGSGCNGRDEGRGRATVTINGRTWRVELATTEDQRYRGLSGRKHLAEDAGMLFVYSRPEVLEFCMRDCYVPLDIAFVDAYLRVVQTYTMAVEPDRAGREGYCSQVPAQFALEVPAGSLAKANVRIGDAVQLSEEALSAAKGQVGP
jgi:uncharacterized membrane protein (UPF0127 family)